MRMLLPAFYAHLKRLRYFILLVLLTSYLDRAVGHIVDSGNSLLVDVQGQQDVQVLLVNSSVNGSPWSQAKFQGLPGTQPKLLVSQALLWNSSTLVGWQSVQQAAFSNLSLDGYGLVLPPHTQRLNATIIPAEGIRTSVFENFLRLSWVPPYSYIIYENVELETDCATLLAYQTYLCNGNWVEGIQVLNSSINIGKWSGPSVTVKNSTLRCPLTYATQQNVTLSACVVVEVRGAEEFYEQLAIQQKNTLQVVFFLNGNVSLLDSGSWTGAPLAPVYRVVVIQGLSSTPSVFDPQERLGLFAVSPSGLLVIRDIYFVNLPYGPTSTGTASNRHVMMWFASSNGMPRVYPLLVYTQNCSYDLCTPLFEYVAVSWYRILYGWGTVQEIARKYMFIGTEQGALFSSATDRLFAFSSSFPSAKNANLTYRTPPRFNSSMVHNPNTERVTYGYNIPLGQLTPVGNALEMSRALLSYEANPNLFMNSYTVALWNSVSLPALDATNSSQVWPLQGILINQTCMISRSIHIVYLDLNSRADAFVLSPTGRLTFADITLINMPVLPTSVQEMGAFTSGLWFITHSDMATARISVVNVTLVIPPDEFKFLPHAHDLGIIQIIADANYTNNANNTAETTMVLNPLDDVGPWRVSALQGFGYVCSEGLTLIAANDSSIANWSSQIKETGSSYSDLEALYSANEPPMESDSWPPWKIGVVTATTVVGGCFVIALLVILGMHFIKRCSTGEMVRIDSSMPGSGSLKVHLQENSENKMDVSGDSAILYNHVDCKAGNTEVRLVNEMDQRVKEHQIIINAQRLVLGSLIHEGAQAKVFNGRWNNLDVAVKIIDLGDGVGEKREAAAQEAGLLTALSHKNVVITYAYDVRGGNNLRSASAKVMNVNDPVKKEQPRSDPTLHLAASPSLESSCPQHYQLFLVQELCRGGSLRQEVATGRPLICPKGVRADPTDDQMQRIIAFALQIAQGMAHVHAKGIIHGDLNPNNILLQTHKGSTMDLLEITPKVADFGLSVVLDPCQTHKSNMAVGTLFYIAPEVMSKGTMTQAHDVYAFGVIMWELYHGKAPWYSKKLPPIIHSAKLLDWSPSCPHAYAEVAQLCLMEDRTKRPSFAEIVTCIQLMSLLGAHEQDMEVHHSLLKHRLVGTGGYGDSSSTLLLPPRSFMTIEEEDEEHSGEALLDMQSMPNLSGSNSRAETAKVGGSQSTPVLNVEYEREHPSE